MYICSFILYNYIKMHGANTIKMLGNVRYDAMSMPICTYLPDTFILLVVNEQRKTKTTAK